MAKKTTTTTAPVNFSNISDVVATIKQEWNYDNLPDSMKTIIEKQASEFYIKQVKPMVENFCADFAILDAKYNDREIKAHERFFQIVKTDIGIRVGRPVGKPNA